jgi:hypothetical protein
MFEMKRSIKITRGNLIQVAIESVRHGKGLGEFHNYVGECRKLHILDLSDIQLKMLVEDNKNLIFGRGIEKINNDQSLSDKVNLGDGLPTWSRMVVLKD